MTPQEQQMLQDLTARVNQAPAQEKDPEAEQYLAGTLGRNPDALYVLAQTVLVQQYALDQAKQQLDQVQQQLDQVRQQAAQQQPPPQAKHTSFLGSLLGQHDDPPPPPQAQYNQTFAPAPPAPYGQPMSSQQGYGQPGYAPAQYAQPSGGGFLQSAIRTAAGVAAGAFAFQGLEGLMHGFGEHAGYGAGFGGFGGGGFGGGSGREEIVNNYYGDSGSGGEARDEQRGGDDLGSAAGQDFSAGGSDNSAFDPLTGSDDSSSFDDSSANDNFDPGGNDNSF